MSDDSGYRDIAAEILEQKAREKMSDKFDFFAGCALSGLLAGALNIPAEKTGGQTLDYDWACRKAYELADMMMKERQKAP
jgi:patatin-like phospholipase/acyl hydrolase